MRLDRANHQAIELRSGMHPEAWVHVFWMNNCSRLAATVEDVTTRPRSAMVRASPWGPLWLDKTDCNWCLLSDLTSRVSPGLRPS